MVLTLRELLERIRPAGAPGAPAEGERQRRRADGADEIAEITAALVEFEAEADAVVAAAEVEAKRDIDQARRRARRIGSTLPDRVAVASAEVSAGDEGRITAGEAEIRAQTDREVARLIDQAEAGIPHVVEAAVQLIWQTASGEQEPRR